uniref:NADH dehydrogenase subunit 1 n=1 Tax=Erianthus versicolor TaxID=470935 RepID=UPI00241146F0|nr:NADH dehydrogenase subunit 1 [Erianthus versicolor]WEL32783.1 NADH dehydrogenase subunit 1 [Erianthus versicolor]
MKDFFMFFMSYLILLLCILLSVAFLTLFERKILGYIQLRKGPNSVSFLGIFQPFSDALKLLLSEQPLPSKSNYWTYFMSPLLSLMISLLVWVMFPYLTFMCSFNYSMLFFFCCTSISVYTIMIAGWSSNSNYSLLGSLRSVAQTISYEVSLSLMFISLILLIESFNVIDFFFNQQYIWFIFISFPLFLSCLASCLAETNRTPFDFSEGESELVSGFNVEYGSGSFTLIFLAEYSSIIFMSMMLTLMFLGGDLNSPLFFFKLISMVFLFCWVRGTLPRYRYDKLMYLAWKSFLPLSLNFILFFIGLKSLMLVI